ncbi:MAG: YqgE/AlgH family protein [Congregibacter sp.]|nr:YqgE/AlgH family protein [Congregibacter sp.]
MRISSSDCLRDHFLLAMPGLDAGLFSGSITYICEHGEAGAMGIIINQPLDLSLKEVFDHLDMPADARFADYSVLAGGPVQVDHGFVLHPRGSKTWDSSLRVTPDIQLTASSDILRAIAAGEGPEKFVVALGYAGWSAGQLEAEIANNSWLTLPAEQHIIFDTAIQDRVTAAAAALGIDMNLMSSQAGHA